MTDLVTPGEVDAEIDNLSAGHTWMKHGIVPWIVDGVDIAGNYSTIDTSGVSGFTHDATNDLTVTISGGEAYVGGWLVRDRSTDVTVPDGATSIIYVGYDPGQTLGENEAPADNENIVIGTESDFDDTMPKAELHEVTASGGTVDSVSDERRLEQPLRYNPATNYLEASLSLSTTYTLEAQEWVSVREGTGGGRMREGGGNFYIEPYIEAGEFSLSDAIEWRLGLGYWSIPSNPEFPDGVQNRGTVDNSTGDGVILPDLGSSGPQNPEPGQIWYDSTAEE